MLRIRFLRTGKKNQPFFRLVVTDKRNPPRGGRFLEVLGFFNPFTKEKSLKGERIKYWISVGAKPSDRVHNLLVSEKVIKGEKIAVHAKAKKKKEEESAPAKTPTSTEPQAAEPVDKPADKQEKPAEKKPVGEKPAKPLKKLAEKKPEEGKKEKPLKGKKEDKSEKATKPAEPAEEKKPETEKK